MPVGGLGLRVPTLTAHCWSCGLDFTTSVTRCEKRCPNCGWRHSCHD